MKIINKILNWFLLSSKNPLEASLTFKGILIGAIPLIIGVLQLTNVTISTSEINAFISQSAVGVQDILYVVASLVTAYGAIRKVYLTVKSKQSNQMVSQTINQTLVGSTVNQHFPTPEIGSNVPTKIISGADTSYTTSSS